MATDKRGKIYNPASGRWVLRSGPTGKMLRGVGTKGKVYNPDTGRWVQISVPKPAGIRHRRPVKMPCKGSKKKSCVADSNCTWARGMGCRTKPHGIIASGMYSPLF